MIGNTLRILKSVENIKKRWSFLLLNSFFAKETFLLSRCNKFRVFLCGQVVYRKYEIYHICSWQNKSGCFSSDFFMQRNILISVLEKPFTYKIRILKLDLTIISTERFFFRKQKYQRGKMLTDYLIFISF